MPFPASAMSIVNGHYCANCSEELLAKRGIDPRESPTKAALEEATRHETQPLGQNAPKAGEPLGGNLNLYA